jgi:hypothetical protein
MAVARCPNARLWLERYRFKSFFTRNPIEIMLPHTSLTLMSDATNACIYPEGLYDMLTRLDRDYNVEILITENGRPDGRDHSGDGEQADDHRRPYPFFLAHAIEALPDAFGTRLGSPADWLVEWKYDGIRALISRKDILDRPQTAAVLERDLLGRISERRVR